MDIRLEVEDISPVKKKLKVEVSAEVAGKEFNQIANDYRKHARLPGFRPGKAPLQLVKRRFQKDIRKDVLQRLIPESYDEALREREVKPLGDLRIEQLSFEEGESLLYEAQVEVLPEITLPEYTGLEVQVPTEALTEEMVEEQLERMRQRQAPLVTVSDRTTAVEGDHVTVDLKGEYLDQDPDRKPAEPIEEEGATLQLGGEHTHKSFDQALQGMDVGEEKTFEVTYDADYPEEKLAGHHLRFGVRLNEIKLLDLPDLDDEFARGLGDFENLDKLKDKIREELSHQLEHNRTSNLRQELVAKLIEATDFEVPELLIENRIDDKVRDLAYDMARQGLNPTKANVDWAGMRSELRAVAEKETRAGLILGRIADQEGFEVSSQEIGQELEGLAESTNQPIDKLRQHFQEDSRREGLLDQIRRRKALDVILEGAQVSGK